MGVLESELPGEEGGEEQVVIIPKIAVDGVDIVTEEDLQRAAENGGHNIQGGDVPTPSLSPNSPFTESPYSPLSPLTPTPENGSDDLAAEGAAAAPGAGTKLPPTASARPGLGAGQLSFSDLTAQLADAKPGKSKGGLKAFANLLNLGNSGPKSVKLLRAAAENKDKYVGFPGQRMAVFFAKVLNLSLLTLLILSFAIYVLLAFFFGALLVACGDFDSYSEAFNLSFESFSTIGYGYIWPTSTCGNVMVSIETVVSIFYVSFSAGLLFARFAAPPCDIYYANVFTIEEVKVKDLHKKGEEATGHTPAGTGIVTEGAARPKRDSDSDSSDSGAAPQQQPVESFTGSPRDGSGNASALTASRVAGKEAAGGEKGRAAGQSRASTQVLFAGHPETPPPTSTSNNGSTIVKPSGLAPARWAKARGLLVRETRNKILAMDGRLTSCQQNKKRFVLKVRVVNGKSSRKFTDGEIMDARFFMTLMRIEDTSKGEKMLFRYRLDLVQSQFVSFRTTVMLQHVVDESSPFFEYITSKEAFKAQDMVIQVCMTGVDGVLQDSISAIRTYSAEDCVWGRKFARMTSYDGATSTVTVDFSKLDFTQRPEIKDMEKQKLNARSSQATTPAGGGGAGAKARTEEYKRAQQRWQRAAAKARDMNRRGLIKDMSAEEREKLQAAFEARRKLTIQAQNSRENDKAGVYSASGVDTDGDLCLPAPPSDSAVGAGRASADKSKSRSSFLSSMLSSRQSVVSTTGGGDEEQGKKTKELDELESGLLTDEENGGSSPYMELDDDDEQERGSHGKERKGRKEGDAESAGEREAEEEQEYKRDPDDELDEGEEGRMLNLEAAAAANEEEEEQLEDEDDEQVRKWKEEQREERELDDELERMEDLLSGEDEEMKGDEEGTGGDWGEGREEEEGGLADALGQEARGSAAADARPTVDRKSSFLARSKDDENVSSRTLSASESRGSRASTRGSSVVVMTERFSRKMNEVPTEAEIAELAAQRESDEAQANDAYHQSMATQPDDISVSMSSITSDSRVTESASAVASERHRGKNKKSKRSKLAKRFIHRSNSKSGSKASNSNVAIQLRQKNRPIMEKLANFSLYHYCIKSSWTKNIVGMITALLGVIILFGIFYALDTDGFAVGDPELENMSTFAQGVFFSFQTISTIGYGVFSPVSSLAHFLVVVETLIGLVFVTALTGIAWAKASTSDSQLRWSHGAVFHRQSMKKYVIIRCMNRSLAGRVVQCEFSASVGRLVQGGGLRMTKLELMESEFANLDYHVTLMHEITKSSPLYGLSRKDLEKAEAMLVVLFTGFDEDAGSSVYARKIYVHQDFLFDHYFVDCVSLSPKGRFFYYNNFHPRAYTKEEKQRRRDKLRRKLREQKAKAKARRSNSLRISLGRKSVERTSIDSNV